MNALLQAIPAIFNVLLVCLVFWLIFGIMGVNLFAGRFSKCIDADGMLVNASIVSSEKECSPDKNYTWFTPIVTFDHVPAAYLALFQVVRVGLYKCRRTYIGLLKSKKFSTMKNNIPLGETSSNQHGLHIPEIEKEFG